MLVVRSSPAGEAIGEIGGSVHLLRGNSSAEHRRSHVAVARLLLRMNSHVVAINIRRRRFLDCRIEFEIQSAAAVLSRKLSAVQPCRRKRNFSRARSRCSRNTSESRNSSAIPLMAGST